MNEEQYKELIKEASEKIRNRTINSLLEEDQFYQNDLEKLGIAEKKYQQLNLLDKQREICEEYIHYQEKLSFEYAENAYVAGISDGIRILSVITAKSQLSENYDWVKKILFT